MVSVRKFVASLCLFSIPAVSIATTLSELSTDELSQEAAWIARVRVNQISTSAIGTFPHREIQGELVEIFKGSGDVGDFVSFKLPGGERNGKTYAVMGLPRFVEGQEYVLFLNSYPGHSNSQQALSLTGAAGLTGWTAYKVLMNENNPEFVVRADEMNLVKSVGGYSALHMDRKVEDYQVFVTDIFRSLD
jgi:hypothetical protein